jgi:putative PEP-CTERM system TPR-repeat lipoprotein
MLERISLLFAVALVTAGLPRTASSADDPKRAESHLAEAMKSLKAGNPAKAAIDLRLAVQSDSRNANAHYELGRVQLSLGNDAGAEQELRSAVIFGTEPDKIAGALSQAMMRLGRNQQVIDEIAPGERPTAIEVDVRLARGEAFMALNRFGEARQSFMQAQALPGEVSLAQLGMAQLGVARAIASAGQVEGAAAYLRQILDQKSSFTDGWVLLGQIQRAQGDNEAARVDFDTAIELAPEHDAARIERATLFIANGTAEAAGADLAAVLKRHPKDPRANYLQAMIHTARQDYRAARIDLQRIAGSFDGYPPAYYLMATVDLAEAQFGQAETEINRFLGHRPNDEAGTALLATLLLRRNNLPRSIEVLTAVLAVHPKSVRLLGLLADIYLKNSQPQEAALTLDRIAASAPSDANVLARVAAQRFRIGGPDAAIGELESVVALAPGSSHAALLLVLTELQANRIDAAIAAATAMRARMPDDPLADNLLGTLALRQGDVSAARARFEAALRIKPDFTPAQLNLGQILLLDHHYADARAVFEAVTAHDAGNAAALMALAAVSFAEQDTAGGIARLQQAVDKNPSAVAPRLRLVETFISLRRPRDAALIADQLARLAPNDPQAAAAVGDARLAAGDTPGAIQAHRHLIELTDSGPAHLKLAQTYAAAHDIPAARAALESAVDRAPKDERIAQEFVRFAVATDSVVPSLIYLDGLSTSRSDRAAIDLLKADTLIAAGKGREALPVLKTMVDKIDADPPLVVRLARAQLAIDPGLAIATLTNWLKKHASPDVQFALGGMLMESRRYDDATALFEAFIVTHPGNALALNNLAWLYEVKHDGRALALAERAHDLAPQNIEIIDTLAWLLEKSGDNPRALALLGPIAGDPAASPAMRYHLAVAFARTGHGPDARHILEPLLAAGIPFEGREDAALLIRDIPAR